MPWCLGVRRRPSGRSSTLRERALKTSHKKPGQFLKVSRGDAWTGTDPREIGRSVVMKRRIMDMTIRCRRRILTLGILVGFLWNLLSLLGVIPLLDLGLWHCMGSDGHRLHRTSFVSDSPHSMDATSSNRASKNGVYEFHTLHFCKFALGKRLCFLRSGAAGAPGADASRAGRSAPAPGPASGR